MVPVRRAQDNAKPGTGRIGMKAPIAAPVLAIDVDTKKADQKQDDEINKVVSEEGKASITEEERMNQRDNKADEVEEELPENKIIVITGVETKFTQELAAGDKIRPPGTPFGLKVLSVESDTSATVDGTDLPSGFPMNLFDESTAAFNFDLMKRTPLNKVFAKVIDRLAGGGAVGIFPEGGSHDRTDLLPLKVGISLIAYSALEQIGVNVPVIPVGLCYFRAHRWRGRAVVEYGRPIAIDPTTLNDFKADGAARHKVCNEFLANVEDSMRSVIVSAPDYETLELIHTARRLYQRKKGPLETLEKQDLSRRFVEGYKRLLQLHEGALPQEWLDLQSRIKDYRNELKELGLKDYQVPSLAEEHLDELDVGSVDADKFLSGLQVPYHILHFFVIICVAAIPTLLLNLPVGVMAGLYAEKRRKKALAASKVKIRGFDVS